MRKILGVIIAAGSVMALVVGAAAVKWYVWDIMIGQSGEPDRSMLYWGLPILFLGVAVLGVSLGLALAAKRMFVPRS
ncbi:MAG: hypothetical protein ACC654_09055 [Acidimicrobiia bacterium]